MGFDFDGFGEEHAAPAPAASAMLTLAESDAVAAGAAAAHAKDPNAIMATRIRANSFFTNLSFPFVSYSFCIL